MDPSAEYDPILIAEGRAEDFGSQVGRKVKTPFQLHLVEITNNLRYLQVVPFNWLGEGNGSPLVEVEDWSSPRFAVTKASQSADTDSSLGSISVTVSFDRPDDEVLGKNGAQWYR